MHIYTIVQNQDKSYALHRDKHSCLCPKSMAVMPRQTVQGIIPQPTQMACSTHCPFAMIEHKKFFKDGENGTRLPDGEGLVYIIRCEGQNLEFRLEEPKEDTADQGTQDGKSKIIQM